MRSIGILVVFSIISVTFAQTGPTHGKVVLCYSYANFHVDTLPFDAVKLDDADLSLCTHLISSNRKQLSTLDPWDLDIKDHDIYMDFTGLKQKYPHLKAIFSLHHGALLKHNPDNYSDFTRNMTDFLLRYDFDGLDLTFDLDFINPLPSTDFDKIVSIAQNLTKSFKRSRLSITSWITFRRKIAENYNYAALSKHVDFMYFTQVLYDSKSELINLRNISRLEDRINGLIELGIPSTKILMDLYFTGYQFRSNGTFKKYKDNLKYNAICQLSLKKGASQWEKHFDKSSRLVFLKSKNKSDEISEIIYESTRSLANRAQLAMNLNLAGVIVFPMNVDDYRGKCGIDKDTFDDFGPNVNVTLDILNRKFPLLRTINEAFLLSVNETTGAASCSISSSYYIVILLIGLSLNSLSN